MTQQPPVGFDGPIWTHPDLDRKRPGALRDRPAMRATVGFQEKIESNRHNKSW